MIYVSTGGFRGQPANVVAAELLRAGITGIELSGGAYSATLLQDLQALAPNIRFQVHNYFPPPEVPFVLNLGSLDKAVGDISVAHVERAMEWVLALGGDRYSFHAGFLLDPKVDELGRRITGRQLYDRAESIQTFVSRVTRLSGLAERAGITLMIENNVLSARNASEFAQNPLLMSEPDECEQIMGMMPDSVGLLIDVAHLKVSATSLGFDPVRMLEQCHDRIVAYHLSDNDGLEDSNQPFDNDAWFWPHLKPDVGYYSVEVYDCAAQKLLTQVDLVRSSIRASDQMA